MKSVQITAYEQMKKRFFSGWQTWNVHSTLSHVWMPYGLTLSLCVKEYRDGGYLRETLVGRQNKGAEEVFPLAHCCDYTALRVKWRGLEFTVETAQEDERFVMLVTPLQQQQYPAMLVLKSGFLWNRTGRIERSDDGLIVCCGERKLCVRKAGVNAHADSNLPAMTPYLTLAMTQPAVFYTGELLTVEQAAEFVAQKKKVYEAQVHSHGKNAPLYEAIQCALNWDTIYDAAHERVVSPVSRIWSIGGGGYILFCWDNYFAGAMASIFSSELSVCNLMEITAEMTEEGFVPNFTNATGMCSRDRSQPPVGSAMTLMVARKPGLSWIANALYDSLMKWNKWFFENRSQRSGALSWGSNPYEPRRDNYWERTGVNDRFGAALESGLDNSPMYDDIPFDKEKHLLCLEDVGLTGLYIMDCRALIQLAQMVGRREDIPLLEKRLARAEQGLEGLWDDERGFYYNRRTDTGEFSRRISPTNFYALFSQSIPKERAARIEEHYFNKEEFYGDYVIPSISRNDPAFPDQDYWRGRIWAPMNFLVYLAVGQHKLPRMSRDLAEKSRDLFLKEWTENRHIHENYSGISGEGCDKANSDRFYHWGALLALIWLMEDGEVKGPFAE